MVILILCILIWGTVIISVGALVLSELIMTIPDSFQELMVKLGGKHGRF